MAQLDKLILNALDSQRLGANNYSFVFEKLNNYDKKFEFLNYLNKNRNVILTPSDIIKRVNEIAG